MNRFLSTECRRVKQPLRAWKASFSDHADFIPIGPIETPGEPFLIQPLEEVEVLRSTCVSGEIMVVVSCRDMLYLVSEDDLEERTMRVFRSGRHIGVRKVAALWNPGAHRNHNVITISLVSRHRWI
jgi:hypothetical protein